MKIITFVNLQKAIRHITQSIAVVLLFGGSLLPGFSSQLNKLPSLVNHYRHHLEEHEQIDIGEFIAMHYGEDASHRDEEDHQDLPFFQMSQTSLLAVAQDMELYNHTVQEIRTPRQGFYRAHAYTYLEGDGIFQPPRIA